MSDRDDFGSIKGGDQIASLKTLKMEQSEAHLGGYILNGAAPGTWCPHVWDFAVDDLGVTSVLDVGCGLGYAARYFRDRGCRVQGVDGSPSAAANSVIPECFVQHDFCDGPYVPGASFDLVHSSEFVEHVEERFSGNFLVTFLAATRFALLTYAAPGQRGYNHVNEQPEDYWLARMAAIGFELDHALSAQLRRLAGDHPLIGKHFRNRGLLFRRQGRS